MYRAIIFDLGSQNGRPPRIQLIRRIFTQAKDSSSEAGKCGNMAAEKTYEAPKANLSALARLQLSLACGIYRKKGCPEGILQSLSDLSISYFGSQAAFALQALLSARNSVEWGGGMVLHHDRGGNYLGQTYRREITADFKEAAEDFARYVKQRLKVSQWDGVPGGYSKREMEEFALYLACALGRRTPATGGPKGSGKKGRAPKSPSMEREREIREKASGLMGEAELILLRAAKVRLEERLMKSL